MKKIRTALSCVLILVCILVLTGCMSREEKQKAREYERKAVAKLIEYLGEHYPDAVSVSIDNVTYSTYGVFATYATSCVCMTYEDDGEEYHIIYDVDTGAYYEDRTHDEIAEDLWAKLQELCDFSDFRDWEISYRLIDEDRVGGFSENYYREGEDTLEELLEEDYEFTVTVKYEESENSIFDIDLSAFDEDWNLTFLFTDYVKGRYNVDSSKHTPYSIREYREEVFEKGSSGSQESSYQKNDRLTIYDMEFVWPADILEVSAETEEAPQELVPGAYSHATFTSTDGIQIRLNVRMKTDDNRFSDIYVFFPMERDEQFLIVGYQNTSEYDTWSLDWREDGHIYRWFTVWETYLVEGEGCYTFGYYEKEEEK